MCIRDRYAGVDKGIERFSRLVMPGLLIMIICIAVFSLTLKHTDESGNVRKMCIRDRHITGR